MFTALYLTKADDGMHAEIATLNEDDLPAGNVLVDVAYSTLNYKDGLAITAASPVVRSYPMVPGIDFAGTVVASDHPKWKAGDDVILNGWGVGERHWGGLSQKARVNGDWLIRLPAGMTHRQAMAIGTAGYTAMLCVLAIQGHGVTPASGDVLVTGASGGVGSLAISLLAKLGYRVVASTGRLVETEYLVGLGASEVIDRAELSTPGKPLAKERWAAVCDSVGSHTLANACASTKCGGIVAACGLAQGMDFPSSVAPFILRGVTLAGIDSVMAPIAKREAAWARLASDITAGQLEKVVREVPLTDVVPLARQILDGKIRGRIVVDVAR